MLKFLFFSLAAIQAASSEGCKGILYDGKPYKEQLMKADIYKPSSLAIDYKTSALYFTHIDQTGDIFYKTAKINLKDGKFTNLEVNNGFSLDVDQKNHVIYVGGYKGIYKYNERNNKAQLIVRGINTWNVFYKNVLYYIEFVSQTLFTYSNGKSKPVEELEGIKVYFFVMDDEDYMVYSNGTGVFGKKKGEQEVLYKDVKSVDEIREITLDRNGRVFVLAADGIYRVNKVTESIVKVAEIQDVYGMAFDIDNNLIFSKENSLLRLVPNKDC
ncbi:PREDICTED: ommochrome-binding protein-like [Papilio polytes]|uniref:ommochrome-binding protein-like n=1 Tax=Papilio polytes TaxID=76194 RepID=UPI000675D16B|nr:PREDICTED: ommochrome-binding protein-like [Papilio polytes]